MEYVSTFAWPAVILVLGWALLSQLTHGFVRFMSAQGGMNGELTKTCQALKTTVDNLLADRQAMLERLGKIEKELKAPPPLADKANPARLSQFK